MGTVEAQSTQQPKDTVNTRRQRIVQPLFEKSHGKPPDPFRTLKYYDGSGHNNSTPRSSENR